VAENKNNEKVVFREYPLVFWGMAVPALVVSAFVPDVRVVFVLLSIATIAFASILTVAVDGARGTLILRYRSLIRASKKTYHLNEICFVNVAEDSEGERMYRIELILRSGEIVPLRSGYTTGKAGKERRAQKIRSLLRDGQFIGGVL
jgi:hypothetical protein